MRRCTQTFRSIRVVATTTALAGIQYVLCNVARDLRYSNRSALGRAANSCLLR